MLQPSDYKSVALTCRYGLRRRFFSSLDTSGESRKHLFGHCAFVILLSYFAAVSGLLEQFHYKLEEVIQKRQEGVEFIEDSFFRAA